MSRARRSVRRGPSPLLVLALVVLVGVLTAAGWGTWQYWGSPQVARTAADRQLADLRADWAATDGEPPALVADPEPGAPHWIIRIPALGEDWEWPVAAGVEQDSLDDAVGWYPRTAQPGQVGNFAIAASCITGAQPFRDLAQLEAGAIVVIEGAAAIHTYEIVSPPGELTVQSDESWVLDPVPGQDETEPTQAIITLTTCEDLYPTTDRSVAFGVLTTSEPT